MLNADLDEPGFERFEGAEIAIDRLRQRAGGAAPGCTGFQDFPEKPMMQVTAALVVHGLPDRDWQLIDSPQQFFDAGVMQLGMTLERLVQVRDVCLVMLVVMYPH